jgi:hypothetical protein
MRHIFSSENLIGLEITLCIRKLHHACAYLGTVLSVLHEPVKQIEREAWLVVRKKFNIIVSGT